LFDVIRDRDERRSMEVEYFKDIETDAVYACVGPMAMGGLFRLRNPLASDSQWEFLVPNSPSWDSVHQRIYRNPRVEVARPEEFPSPLPPVPESPPGPFPSWKEHFLPQQPIPSSKYPSVTGLLKKSRSEEKLTVFVVLFEDPYETALGDGEFHYFRGVFLTEADAQRYMDKNRSKGERFYLRTMSIKLDQEVFVFPDFDPELFDHYQAEEVLAALESLLEG
jgi:hypothetical protein